ncbi:hypothetical protein Patl1_08210 [Pistacia atlantica]|nr:hypothetical protein Patl1_08210 [Pistacia atlantica]
MEQISATRSSGEGEARRSRDLQLVATRRSAAERAIEAMLKQGLVKKLVELQRSGLGGDLIEMEKLMRMMKNWKETKRLNKRGVWKCIHLPAVW